MSGLWSTVCKIRGWLPIFFWISCLNAQSCLVLSPATIAADGTASMDLSLYSPRRTVVAGIQWTLQYSSSVISSLTVDDGPALTSAGKAAMCSGDAAAYKCLAVGSNTKDIATGIIARITAVLAPGVGTVSLQITDPLAVSPEGYLISVATRILPNSGTSVSSDCRLHPPLRGSSAKR